jgi:hypothetical protein
VDGRQRRLLYITLISLSALLLAACTPAPLVEEPCPTPINLPLEDEPAVALPEVVITDIPVPEAAEASLTEQPITAAPKTPVTPEATVAPAPVVTMTEDATPEAASTVITGPPPVIVSHTPIDTAGVEWSQDIRILFSVPMDRAATERAISVPGIDYTVSWYRDDKLIRLIPTELLIAFQWYEVNIGADAAAADGARLGTAYGFTFWGEEP